MKGDLSVVAVGVLAFAVVGCGVDPRWGPVRPTNESIPGSPGVDSRWGDRRTGLREPLRWQYDAMSEEAVGAKRSSR